MKFYISVFFENLLRKLKFHYKLTIIMGNLHEDRHTILIISHLLHLRVRNVSDEICTENPNTHFMLNNCFFENEVTLKNILEPDRPQMTMRRMHIACWIIGVANTHPECVLLIAFPLTQWYHERASVLHYAYIGCLVLQCISVYITLLLVVCTASIGGVFLRHADTQHT